MLLAQACVIHGQTELQLVKQKTSPLKGGEKSYKLALAQQLQHLLHAFINAARLRVDN